MFSERPKKKLSKTVYYCFINFLFNRISDRIMKVASPKLERGQFHIIGAKRIYTVHLPHATQWFLLPFIGAVLESFYSKLTIATISYILFFISRLFTTICSITGSFKYFIVHKLFQVVGGSILYDSYWINTLNQFELSYHYSKMEGFILCISLCNSVFAIIFSSVIPLLINSTKCFGQHYCLTLAFGLVNIGDICYIVMLVAGYKLYKSYPVEKYMICHVISCVRTALRERRLTKKTEKKDHWLDYAEVEYDPKLIFDVKLIFNFAKIAMTMSIYIAVFFQKNVVFNVQANKMDRLFHGIFLNQDAVELINGIIDVIIIIILWFVLFPLSRKFRTFYTPLSKLGFAFICLITAYACAAAISSEIDKYEPKPPPKFNCHLRIYNTMNTQVDVKIGEIFEYPFHISELSMNFKSVVVKGRKKFRNRLKFNNENKTYTFDIKEYATTGYYFSHGDTLERFRDDITKDYGTGKVKVRFLFHSDKNLHYEFTNLKDESEEMITGESKDIGYKIVSFGEYMLSVEGKNLTSFTLEMGGVYAVLVDAEATPVSY